MLQVTDRSAVLSGVAMIVAGVTLFAIQDAAGKILSETQSVFQIVWARYAFALPVILAVTPRQSWPVLFRVENKWLQAARALLPVAASFSVVVGLTLLPLAEVTVLTFASPLLVVALSAPLLGERPRPRDWIGVFVGFVGILVIVQPGSDAIAWAALFPLGCAFFFALFQIATRLVGRHDSAASTLAWTIGVGLVVTSLLVIADWRPATATAWALMALTGLCFGGAQFCLIRGFSKAPAALLTPFTYAQIVPAAVLGLVLFGTVPGLWAVAGTLLLIASGLSVLRR